MRVATSRLADSVGRVLGGRYRLIAPLGTGASASVFLAEDVVLRRRVAVKVLHAGLREDETFLKRFRAEAQAAAALNHPNLLKVFDWGEDADGPYLVLEHLGGGSLRDLLDRGVRLTPSQAQCVALDAARALDHAHRRGLVHRDVKPANLLFDDEGRVRIADFGLARALAEASLTEPSGAVLGTARYAAPEQAQGLPVDGRADVYALAMTIVEAVTGTVPFAADTTVATLMARIGRDMVPPVAVGPLADPLAGATRADVDIRSDAATFASALEVVGRDLPAAEPIPVRSVPPPEHPTALVDPTELPAKGSAIFDQFADETPPGAHPITVFDDAEVGVGGSPPPGRRRRRGLRVLVGVIVAAMLGVGTAVGVNTLATPSHPVPSLEGLTRAQAEAEVAPLDFEIEVVREEFDETAAAGSVIEQDPTDGRSLKEGKSVVVVLSKGPAPRGVPDLADLDEAAATASLVAAGLTAKVDKRDDEIVPAGVVIDWTPKGQEVAKGTEVAVVVSNGPARRVVPQLAGGTYDAAVAALAGVQLKVRKVDVFDDTAAPGKVVGSEPKAGSAVPRDSSVAVRVSKGPDVVDVPDVTGMDLDEARATLQSAGLDPAEVYGPDKGRRVLFTDPRAGSKVKRGTGVSLYVGR